MIKIKINLRVLLIVLINWIICALAFTYLEAWQAIIILFSIIFIELLFVTNIFRICAIITTIILIGMISDHMAQIFTANSNNNYIQLLAFFVIYMFLFFTINYPIKLIKKSIRFNSIPVFTKVILIILLFATIFILYLNIFTLTKFSDLQLTKINLGIQVSYFICISLLSLLLISNIKKESSLKYEKLSNQQLNSYFTSLETVNNEMQKFQHDYMNILLTLNSYINQGDLNQLKDYFNTKIVKFEIDTLNTNYLVNSLRNLNILELKSLVLTKSIFAIEKKVEINIEIPQKIEKVPIDIIDFSRLIGILMDNAIEASIECENPFINLAVLELSSNNLLIVIENSFEGEVDLSNIYLYNFSTKDKSRGLGLKTVNEILSKYPNILLNTRIENENFIQEIEMNLR